MEILRQSDTLFHMAQLYSDEAVEEAESQPGLRSRWRPEHRQARLAGARYYLDRTTGPDANEIRGPNLPPVNYAWLGGWIGKAGGEH